MPDRHRHDWAHIAVASIDGRIEVEGRLRCEFGRPPDLTASWSWDGVRLEVKSDPFGFRPLFYWADAHRLVVAESVNPILCRIGNPSLDLTALSVLLRSGHILGDDTPFLGVRQLGPNGVLTWSSTKGLEVRAGPRPAGTLRAGIDREEAIREYARLFQQAVEQSHAASDRERLVVPLSGGRDSRHIAFALHASGVMPAAYATALHQPWRADEDARVAGLVAQALGAPHVVIPQRGASLRNCVDMVRETSFLTNEHGWQLPLRDWVTTNADAVVDGIGGDVMSAALGQSMDLHASFQERDYEKVIRQVSDPSKFAGWEGILPRGLRNALSADIARRRLRQELELHADHHNPARSFFFWNRTRKQIGQSPFCLFRRVRVATPYLMPELWAFLDSLPFDIVADRTFHDETIARAYPTLAAIPYADETARRPLRRNEALGVSLAFLRLLWSLRTDTAIRLPRMTGRGIRSLMDHRVWWSHLGALYLLSLLSVPSLEIAEHDRSPRG